MSITALFAGTGRRRYTPDTARAAITAVEDQAQAAIAAAERQRDAYQAQTLGMQLKLSAADTLIARQAVKLGHLRAENQAHQAARKTAAAEHAALQQHCADLAKRLTAATTELANRDAVTLRAPIDAHPDIYGQPTVPVVTLRAQFGGEAA